MGPRAAEIINESHLKLENELIRYQKLFQLANEQLEKANQTIAALAPHIQRYAAMENLLTNPDRLARYTVDFFTHVHPLPNRTVPQQDVRANFPGLPASSGGSGGFDLAQISPDQRWKVADDLERRGYFRGRQLIG